MSRPESADLTEPSADNAAAADILAKNRQRRRVRRWIGFGSIPVVLVALLLVAKLLSMYGAAHLSIASFITGDGSGASRAAQWQYPLNYFESFKAPFNNAVGLATNQQYTPARAEFEKALAMVSGLEECAVRINLSLTIERLGDLKDKAGYSYAAKKLYDDALLTILQGPKDCEDNDTSTESSSDPDRDMESQREQLEERLQKKQEEQQQKQDGTSPPEGEKPEGSDGEEEKPGPGPEQLEEIEGKLEQGENERGDIGREDDPWGSSETDRPW